MQRRILESHDLDSSHESGDFRLEKIKRGLATPLVTFFGHVLECPDTPKD